ncbi:unnamed protein product, partial [Ixodes persulcatus]
GEGGRSAKLYYGFRGTIIVSGVGPPAPVTSPLLFSTAFQASDLLFFREGFASTRRSGTRGDSGFAAFAQPFALLRTSPLLPLPLFFLQTNGTRPTHRESKGQLIRALARSRRCGTQDKYGW